MKILYDPQIFTWQTYGGISRYFFELMNYFHDSKEVNFELPLFHSYNHYLSKAKFAPHLSLKDINLPKKEKIVIHLNRLNRTFAKSALKGQKFDIFHPTYYETYFLSRLKDKPFVLTVYDLIHEKFSDLFPGVDQTTQYKKELINKADKIIAISENTKKDIIEIYGTNPDKIAVTYLANSFNPMKISLIKNLNLPEKYILYVGDRWTYKNFSLFIKSIAPILHQDKALKVICGGSKPFNDEEKEYLKNLNLTDQVIHYMVTDETLVHLYKNALAFVFPSRYEGFGIPVLEALSCGCPLIVSNQGSLPEVAGDACEYINPYDENSIKNSVEKVIYNDNLRNELINKGYEQAKKFSWEKTAKETKIIYESLL